MTKRGTKTRSPEGGPPTEIKWSEEDPDADRKLAGKVFGGVFVALSLAVLILVGRQKFWSFFVEFKYLLPFLVIFVLATFFPVSAFAYQLFRRATVERRLGRDFWLLGIPIEEWEKPKKQPPGGPPRDQDSWQLQTYTSAVRTLYEHAHSSWNYAIQTTIVVLLTVLGLTLFFWPPATTGGSVTDENTAQAAGQTETGSATVAGENTAQAEPAAQGAAQTQAGQGGLLDENTLAAMRYGFVGAYIFAVWLVYRRYTTLDLQPSVYTNCALTMIGGIGFNFVAFTAIQAVTKSSGAAEGLEGAALAIVAFCLGYFPALALRWFSRIAHSTLGLAQRQADALPLGLIDGISQFHETRLVDEGIDNVQNLAAVALDELLLNTRFSAQEVIEWVDQAILYVYLQAGEIDSFRRAGVRSFTDLQSQWEPLYVQEPKGKRELELIDQQLSQLKSSGRIGGNGQSSTADLAALTTQIENLQKERASAQAAFDQARREKALQFQALPERLDGLYCSTQQGPNVAHVMRYWKRAAALQTFVEEVMRDELSRTTALTMQLRKLAGTFGAASPGVREDMWSGGDWGADEDWEFEDPALNYEQLVGHGFILIKQGAYEKAVDVLQRAVDKNPEKKDAYELLAAAKGHLAARTNDKDKARSLVEEAEGHAQAAAVRGSDGGRSGGGIEEIASKALDLTKSAIEKGTVGDVASVINAWAQYQETRRDSEKEALRMRVEQLQARQTPPAPVVEQEIPTGPPATS